MQTIELPNNLMPSATIIIPAYNEEERIGKVLDEIKTFLRANDLSWDVIVSIDGNDGTEEIVKSFSSGHSSIKYQKGQGRSGKGYAIKRVVDNSTGEFTLIMDADGAVGLAEIVRNFHYLTNYDVILFDRYTNGENRIPLFRRIPSRGFNILVRTILGLNVRDTQCGYKIVRTDLIKEAFRRVGVTNTFFDVALLYHIKKMGGRIKEVDVRYSHDEKSKFNIMTEIVGQGTSLLAFRLRHSRFYKYVPHWATEVYLKKFRWI
ncbi:MAG: glycosyltransferase [Thermoplasmatales archaeon]|nr:glycosyltransferase [Thermoplasmatales archaeon]